jgi:hypothetical protein
MWVAIHKCMEAMLRFSLYSYLYFKLAKMLRLSYYLLCFLFNKIGEEEDRTSSAQKQGVGEGGGGRWPETVYTHVSKCRNDLKHKIIKKIKY